MVSEEVRRQFLKFFEDRGHRIVPSAPVIPHDDPTLLFTNAGMNQFKDVFLGTGKRDYIRAADTQKCIRVSGKHNDLEEVGRDTYHHTFFEMLGNWSFGDYYKKEAIGWAWELLTGVWGIEKRRLYATVYETDDEAEQLWRKVTDIPQDHVLRFGKKDNFWEMGETGPCGPCSEIHIDLTPDRSGKGLVNSGDPRVMEIWNLVFIQYDRDSNGTLTPLPSKHVDTGMGFERICAILQKKSSNYDTDVFTPIISKISDLTGVEYRARIQSETDVALRVIADHIRMLSFSIADGAMPSNEGRGYVVRRILRRAARFGRTLGMKEPFIFRVAAAVADSMGRQFPEVVERQAHVERVIRGEEESFNATIDRGLEIFTSVLRQVGSSKIFPGEDAFKLYDTYGFPLDLTEMMAAEKGLEVDLARFTELMRNQRERSQAGSKSHAALGPITVTREGQSEADGLTATDEAMRRFDFDYRELDVVTEIEQSDFLVATQQGQRRGLLLSKTTFYAESGGQVSDTGELIFSSPAGEIVKVQVEDLVKKQNRILHIVSEPPRFADMKGWPVRTHIDHERRMNIMRNHTATHIVHEALRRVLGTHLRQHGSLVDDRHLRFDFNHFEKISPDQLRKIEDMVNEKITQRITVHALNDAEEWVTIDEARRKYPGIKMFFGEKYGNRVRVVEIDPAFSVELCGGTHVGETGELGLFKIISESSVASGVRRIEAVTGPGLDEYIRRRIEAAKSLDSQIEKLLIEKQELERQLGRPGSTSRAEEALPPAVVTLDGVRNVEAGFSRREAALEEVSRSLADLRKELSGRRVKAAGSLIDDIIDRGVPLSGFRVASGKIDVGNAEELKSLADELRVKIS